MKRSSYGSVLVLGTLLAGTSLGFAEPAAAQAPADYAPYKNLQFFPKDISTPQLLATMQRFDQALGVTCRFCHVGVAGGQNNDMATDMKPTKRTARVMLALVRDLNAKLPGDISAASDKPAGEIVRVGCITCHRGVTIPKQLVDVVMDTASTKGAPAAIAQYRDLRKEFYGNQAYDFTDLSLVLAAQRSIAAMKPEEAIAFANANLEFNPMSGRSYEVMSRAYQARRDTANALAAMEKAVATEPMNQAFATELSGLKKAK